MAEEIKSKLRVAAMQGATDSELCALFELSETELGRYRNIIDAARTAARVRERFARSTAVARRGKGKDKPAETTPAPYDFSKTGGKVQ
jgi:hypothetical protein